MMTQYGTLSPEAATGTIPEGDALLNHADRSLLIVDDDKPFSTRLARAMEARGYRVHVAESVAEGVSAVDAQPPAFAVIDMRLADGNGLDVIARLKERRPEARGVILTGYGNIATAVTAVKLGAFDYLAKPADADEIHGTLMAEPGERADPPENPMSADRVRWEHIQRVYELCGRNVSETARRLNMHRRTLQRILAKRAPR
ncbi:chemotaxis protein CheY [Methylobacterium indicum]|uniref:Chemotaxis protein CheY n=2 Tax=Methylobacterium indicum TaxID=1775910 RepID=A0ABR5HHR5_9HYPH|nr:chemotaxis protein CheY [Methylobacterium indicum]KMO26239.1 chemotaxis protein CheY [Methylobacterium indicum]KTS38474.1 chemotaxis protein CheY [Methylobacterium indicum]KTS42000.1 chemotaxis protein CheY [Methylobacterium indicum]KTS47849.1 chemotaxis protein CheY [Methylobacterium indicum]